MTEPLAEIRDRYLAVQLTGDRHAVITVLDEALAQGVSARDLEVHVVGGAQRAIGRMWERNQLGVAEEHAATAVSQFALAHLYRHHARSARNGRRVVVACVEGEMHDMGARIVSDLLEAAGFDVRFLGANVPTDSLVETLRAQPCDLLALAVTLSIHFGPLDRTLARVRSGVSATLPIVVGGFAQIQPDVRHPGVTLAQGDANAFVHTASQILGLEP